MNDLVLNISCTDYEIFRDVGQSLGWFVDDYQEEGDWDVLWTDFALPHNRMLKVRPD